MSAKSLFMTVAEAAKEAGYSVRHFRRFITTGEVKIVPFGRANGAKHRTFRVLRAEFDRWQTCRGVL